MKQFIVAILFLPYQCSAMEKVPEIYPCKNVPVTIHTDLYRPLVACLARNKAVKDVFCGDYPFRNNVCTVYIATKDMIHPDKTMDRFYQIIAQKTLGKNAKRKLKNIIAAYKELSDYRMREHVSFDTNGVLHMIHGWRSVYCPDIMEYFYNLSDDLPKLCAIAKLPYVE